MGGGRGTRMYPLTKYRSKPAVPLGAKYRLIDVPISNCLNSGLSKILVLTQYNSESLNKHIFRTYKFDNFSKGFVEILAASQSYERTEWFQGTADSVRQSLPHINDPLIDEVIVLSGDQLYSMDLRELQKYHREKGADITVAGKLVPVEDVGRFGVMDADREGVIRSFLEKPKDPSLLTQPPILVDGTKHYLANMGIYIFKKNVLTEVLTESDKADFGKEIIPASLKSHKVFAYPFNGYWCDVGTIASYYHANIMMTENKPMFDLYDEEWQVYTRQRNLPPARMMKCRVEQSIVAEGCVLEDAVIERSVIGIRSIVGAATQIKETMIVGNDYYESDDRRIPGAPPLGIGSECLIQNAIVDKNVRIGNRVKIVNKKNEKNADGNGYSIRDGIVVVHKNAVIPDGTVI